MISIIFRGIFQPQQFYFIFPPDSGRFNSFPEKWVLGINGKTFFTEKGQRVNIFIFGATECLVTTAELSINSAGVNEKAAPGCF